MSISEMGPILLINILVLIIVGSPERQSKNNELTKLSFCDVLCE